MTLALSTGEMLDRLSQIGCPMVRRMKDGGWLADIDLPAPTGVTANVRSDFNCASHQAALQQLIERLGAVAGLGDRIDAILTAPTSNVISLEAHR